MAKELKTKYLEINRGKSFAGRLNPLQQYCVSHTVKLAPCQEELQKATLKHQRGMMAGAPEVITINMHFMRLIKAKRVLDVGTFTGISALAAALATPSDGEVITMDITDEYYKAVGGREIMEKILSLFQSGVANKIKFCLESAHDTLDNLKANGEVGKFDFAFVDAGNKEGYPRYYTQCKELLRSGGVMVFDNVLWHESVTDTSRNDATTNAFRTVNKMAYDDDDVDSMLINVGDGMLIVFKK